MPVTNWFAINMMILSSITASFSSLFDYGLTLFVESDDFNYEIYAMDALWFTMVIWLTWQIVKRQEGIQHVVGLLCACILGLSAWEYIEEGFSFFCILSLAEFTMMFVAWVALHSESSRCWFSYDEIKALKIGEAN